MSDPAPQHDLAPAPPVQPNRRWRRLFWGVALLLAVGIAFYQPIGTWVLERVMIEVARQANVGLRLKVGGNLLTRLTIEGLHGEAIGETPVKELSVAHAEFRYSFPRMLRRGVTDFLSSYELRNATVEIDQLPEGASEDARTQAERLTELLRDILQQPALFSNRVELENVNVRLNLTEGLVRLDSIHILLDPQEKGFIRVGRVDLPWLPEWHQVNAEATYNGRRLVVDRLELGENMAVVHAELIPARVTGAEDILMAKLAVFGGQVNIDLRSEGKNASLKLDGRDISITKISHHFTLQPPLEGKLETLAISLQGESDDPSTWDGQFELRVTGSAVNDFRAGEIQLHAALEDGQFRMYDTRVISGKNELALKGEQAFPGSFSELLDQGLALRYKLLAPEMQAWSPSLPSGALEAEGDAMAGRKKIAFSTQAQLTDWRLLEDEETKLMLSAAEVKGDVTLALSERNENTPWFTGLTSHLIFSTRPGGEGSIGVADQSIALDRVALELRQSGREVTLKELSLERKENRIALEGQAKLPVALEAIKAWEELEFDAGFAIHVPSLEDFNVTGIAQELKGRLEGEGTFRRAAGKMAGKGKLEASELGWREFQVRRLTVDLPLEEVRLPKATLLMEINDTDRLEATISADLASPYAYDVALSAQIGDLGIFTPFAGRPLGGALRVNWHAAGRFDTPEHRGEGRLSLTDGLVDLHHPLNAEIALRYSPEEIIIGQLKASAPEGSLSATARWAEQRLTVNDLTLQAGEHGSTTGHLSLPLDLRTPTDLASLLPEDGALEGAFVVRQIDLAKVLPPSPPPPPEPKKRSRKKSPPKPTGAEGVVDATLALGGTMAAPELMLEVKGRKLRSRAAEKLAAADVDATVTLKEKVLKLTGEARTPNVQPLRFEGEVPLDVRKVIAEGALDPSTPVSASVVLPSSSASVLRNFSPAIRYIEGTLRLDADVKGTVGKPVFSGGAYFDLPAIRMTNTSIPGINRFRGDLLFSGDRLTVQRFDGDIAGGPFELSGEVGLKEWSAPQLNLRLKSTGTLLVRNDTLTVRTDTNLKIAGPLQSAEVKGKVTLRKSRFYRDVEILPVALPGKPVAEPVGTTQEVSIDVPPVRDWKFDFAVKTKEPFLIRSNMARGAAAIDLRVGGTGLAPTLDGTVRLENLVASLPFSRLTIEQGFVRFNPSDSFDPSLDIHGSSPVRGTMVHAHIYGTASEPETIFTSEPPLPQEEIIALLATGATTQGLAENNQVMAGRAGSLLLQDLYRKISRQRPQKKMENAGDDPLGDRFSLDVGTVDPRTGRQEVGGRFRLNEEFELGGGVDIEGDVRVQLRYLLRFR